MKRLNIGLQWIVKQNICTPEALAYLRERIANYRKRKTHFVPEDIEYKLSEKHEFSIRDRTLMAWFYLAETEIWPDIHQTPVLGLKWGRLQIFRQLSHAFLAPVTEADYYRILQYMICDRADKDDSFFQGAKHYAVAYKKNMLLGIYCKSCLTGYLVTRTESSEVERKKGNMQLRPKTTKYLKVQYLEIFPPYQKQGLGRTAIRLLAKKAKGSFSHIALEPTPYAQDFYRKIGFQIKKVYQTGDMSDQELDSSEENEEDDDDDDDDSSSDDDYDLHAVLKI